MLLLLSGTLADAQQAPQPTATPIAVPTLPPTPNPITQAIVNAAVGVVKDIIQRNHENAANSVSGTVSYFRRFDMQVKNGSNSYRSVHLHQGTVINPRGATPSEGRYVDVSGVGQPDGSINADVITVHQ